MSEIGKQIVKCTHCGSSALYTHSLRAFRCVKCGNLSKSSEDKLKEFFGGFNFDNNTGGK